MQKYNSKIDCSLLGNGLPYPNKNGAKKTSPGVGIILQVLL